MKATRALIVILALAGATIPGLSRADSSAEASGAPPWVGVAMDKGSDLGVRVEHVVRGSPAEKAGIKAGDRIVAVDAARVTRPEQVSQAVAGHRVGDTVTVGLERTGNPISAPVVLAARPTVDAMLRMDLVGAPAPDWKKATPIAGAPASIASLKGKVVLVDFWASWCGPCKLSAPRLSALKDRYGAQGFTVVGITTDDAERAASAAERIKIRYPILSDESGETNKAYNVTSLPTMILVDKKGVVRDAFIGFDPRGDARLESTLTTLLAEKSAP